MPFVFSTRRFAFAADLSGAGFFFSFFISFDFLSVALVANMQAFKRSFMARTSGHFSTYFVCFLVRAFLFDTAPRYTGGSGLAVSILVGLYFSGRGTCVFPRAS